MEVVKKFGVSIYFGSCTNNKFVCAHTANGYLVVEKIHGTKCLSVYNVSDRIKKTGHVLKESTDMLPEIAKITGKSLGAVVKKAMGYNNGYGSTAASINKDMVELERKYDQHKQENFNLSGIEQLELRFSLCPKTKIDIYPDKTIIKSLGFSHAVIKHFECVNISDNKYRQPMMQITFNGSNSALEFADMISDILYGATLIKHEKSWSWDIVDADGYIRCD